MSSQNKQRNPSQRQHNSQRQEQYSNYNEEDASQNPYQQDEQQRSQGSDPFVMRVKQQIQQRLNQQQHPGMGNEHESPGMQLDNSVDERPNVQLTPSEQLVDRRTMNQVNLQQRQSSSQTDISERKPQLQGGGSQRQHQTEQAVIKNSSSTKVVDLSMAQPYQSLNSLEESPTDSIEQQENNTQKYQMYQQMMQKYVNSGHQQQEYQEENQEEEDEENFQNEDEEEVDNEEFKEEDEEQEQEYLGSYENEEEIQEQEEEQNEQELDEIDPYQYQQIVDELIQENDIVKTQLIQTQNKLEKVEQQLQKTKTMLREVGTIRDDIMHLKQTAEEAEDVDSVVAENEILKAKIGDLETKVNTMSRGENDFQEIRSREKLQFERKINDLKDENYRTIEKYRGIAKEIEQFQYSLDQANKIIEIRDKSIKEIEASYQLLQEEHFKVIKENKAQSSQLQQLIETQNEERVAYTGAASGRSNPYTYQEQQQKNNSKHYIALRNRSQDKNNQILSQNSQFNKQLSQSDLSNDHDLSRGLTNELPYNDKRQSNMQNPGISDFQPHSFLLDESNYNHPLLSHQLLSNEKNGENRSPNLDNQYHTQPQQQPVKITLSLPSKQSKVIVERCQKLEQYCRELVKANNILDCENRLAIAQLIHLTDGRTQLNSLVSALNIVAKSGKIYDKKRLNQSQVQSSSNLTNQRLSQQPIKKKNYGLFKTPI